MAETQTAKKIEDARAYVTYQAGLLRRKSGKFRRREELRLQRKLVRLWKKQLAWLLDEMKTLSFFQKQNDGVRLLSTKELNDEVNDLVQKLPNNDKIVDEIVFHAKKGYQKGAKDEYKHFDMSKLGISFDLVNEDAIAYLNRLEDLHLSNYRGSITRTTRKRIIKILRRAAETGQSYQKTSKLIQEQAAEGIFSQARGELIATREIGKAYTQGNRDMVERFAKETGAIMQKEWITVEDDKVTPECAENQDAGWLGFDEHFPSGDLNAPRDDHPRCRCDTGYRRVNLRGEPII